MKHHKYIAALILLTALSLCLPAYTSFSQGYNNPINVVKQGSVKSTIELSGLAASGGSSGQTFRSVLQADLERSGWFRISRKGQCAFSISGSCSERGKILTIQCVVKNNATGRTVMNKPFSGKVSEYRTLAHKAADEIIEKIKGVPGIASTRIVMIGSPKGAKEIYVCDSDGNGLKQITSDRSISVSPEWTHDGEGIVYTSFRTAFPYIYKIDMTSNPPKRKQLTDFPGLNVCASISPDGKKMALSLSKDGNPDLYVMDLRTHKLKRITRTQNAAEASPSWSPDSRRIVYVSDKSRKPHLYVARADGTGAKRLTHRGSENVAPDWGPGNVIVFSSRRGGQYVPCLIDPNTRDERVLEVDGADYEDPSWAPDGRHIVCTRTENHEPDVYILDTMDDAPIRLTRGSGDWHSPAWSPK